jgi:hypothetical protein
LGYTLEGPVAIIRSNEVVSQKDFHLSANIFTEYGISVVLEIIVDVIFLIWIDDRIREEDIN